MSRIIVIGDLIIDRYIFGSSERISPEAPVPIVKVSDESIKLGGAGNVVSNLRALGATVDFISVVGACNLSSQGMRLLNQIEVETDKIIIEV